MKYKNASPALDLLHVHGMLEFVYDPWHSC